MKLILNFKLKDFSNSFKNNLSARQESCKPNVQEVFKLYDKGISFLKEKYPIIGNLTILYSYGPGKIVFLFTCIFE